MPTFDRNPLDVADEAVAADPENPAAHVARALVDGRLGFACTDPDAPHNWPRVLTVWRANLLGSSAKGNEYFLRHLLGTDSNLRATETPPDKRPHDVTWRDDAPEGKLDLLLSLDFRMTSTTLFSDIVLPAATWYEKHDLNSTDMHPFVHAFTPAINPPWQTRTDFTAFHGIARAFSALAKDHLGVRKDLVAAPLLHDTADAMATPGGVVRDWKDGDVAAVPGRTMPKFVVVERDYGAVAEKMAALGPLLDRLGTTTKAVTVDVTPEIEGLTAINGTVRGGVADGRPRAGHRRARVRGDPDAVGHDQRTRCHGRVRGAGAAHRAAAGRPGPRARGQADPVRRHAVAAGAGHHQPGVVRTASTAAGGTRRSPSTPNGSSRGTRSPVGSTSSSTTTGCTRSARRCRFSGHRWTCTSCSANHGSAPTGELEITLRYLTPHSKWSIHSEYQDNLIMLTLSRGGPTMWMSEVDAAKIGVRDNDWIEAVNRNGVVVCRAVVDAQDARGDRVHVPRAGTRDRRAEGRDATAGAAASTTRLTRLLIKPSAPDRRLRATVVRVQLPRSDRQPTRRGHRRSVGVRRRWSTEMRIMAQMSMVMNLDKCIGCHTCSVTCKQAWTNRSRRRVRVVQQRRVAPGAGLPAHVPGPGALAGRLDAHPVGAAEAARRRPAEEAVQHLRQSENAGAAGLLRAVDLRLRAPAHGAGR